MTHSGNLAEPVGGNLDADGRLISADPPLMRLHLHCGGYEGGPLAIPALARLCRLSKRLGMALSRHVRVADEDNLIDLWAETRPGKTGVDIAISDWAETSNPALSDAEAEDRKQDFDRLNALGQIRTDSVFRIMSIILPGDTEGSQELIGESLLDVLSVEPAAQKEQLVLALEERQSIKNQRIAVKGRAGAEFRISGGPLINGSGFFSGYNLRVAPIDSGDGAETEVPGASGENMINNSLFGSQLGPVLRQPLGKIIANAETIGSQLEGPLRGDYASYAKDIPAAGRHLMDLVDDLSDLEAIERPDFSVAVDDIDLIDLAHRAGGLLAVKASDHQIRIDLPPEDRNAPASGEFRRVLQILVNLIGNAVRYSPDGSVIKVTVKEDGDQASISVADQGPGIAVEDRDRIFEKFERLGRSGDGGTGLGLFISRRLATAMDGDLTVTGAPGKGAIFTLTLPVKTDS